MSNNLSKREAQILRLVAEGLTDKEVAKRLGISKNTVATHIHRVLVRRGLRSRTAAVAELLSGMMTTRGEPRTEPELSARPRQSRATASRSSADVA